MHANVPKRRLRAPSWRAVLKWTAIGLGGLLVVLVLLLAFATSLPELVVNLRAVWIGQPYLALGNAMGSTIANLGLSLGLAAVVAPLLQSADSDLRIFSAQLVGRLPHPDRLPLLTGLVERDPHVDVCLAAVEALMEAGHPEVLPSLERLAGRFPNDPFVAFSVDAARRLFAGS